MFISLIFNLQCLISSCFLGIWTGNSKLLTVFTNKKKQIILIPTARCWSNAEYFIPFLEASKSLTNQPNNQLNKILFDMRSLLTSKAQYRTFWFTPWQETKWYTKLLSKRSFYKETCNFLESTIVYFFKVKTLKYILIKLDEETEKKKYL